MRVAGEVKMERDTRIDWVREGKGDGAMLEGSQVATCHVNGCAEAEGEKEKGEGESCSECHLAGR